MKRVLLIIAPLLLLLFLAIGVGAYMLRAITNPDYLVRQIESTYNCRAEISKADLKFFANPATLEIYGLSLGERDDYAEKGTPLSQREPLVPVAHFPYSRLEVESGPLLSRRLVVRHFSIERPRIEFTIHEDGKTTFDELIKPAPGKVSQPSSPVEPDEKVPSQSSTKGFVRAADLPIDAIKGRIEVENATILATIAQSKTTVEIHEGIVVFSDVDIVADDLATHNSANLNISAWVAVDSFEKDTRYMDLWLDGEAFMQPFDHTTGELNPSMTANVIVRKDSWLDALPVLDDMEELLKNLDRFGVNLKDIRLRGDFSEDTKASFNVNRQKVTLQSDFLIPIDANFIGFQRDSWIDIGKNNHEFGMLFLGSDRLTRKVEDEMTKYLQANMGKTQASLVKATMLPLIKQDEFLVIQFASSGDLGDPNVSLVSGLGQIENLQDLANQPEDALKLIKGQAGDLLQNLLGGDNP